MIVFLNGAFTKEDEARIAPADRGLTLGDGVFDTMLAVDGKPVLAAEHFARLLSHAAALAIPHAPALDQLENTALTLLQKNDAKSGRYAIRTTVTRGAAARGLAPDDGAVPTILMRVSPAPAPADLPPLHAVVARETRRNDQSPLSRIKSLQYGDNLLALMEAKKRGGNDAILLNTKDHVACAATGNIFILEGKKLVTPPPEEGAMEGITRGQIIRHHDVIERPITLERLAAAAAVFVTNSLSGVRAASMLDGRALPAVNLSMFGDLLKSAA